MATERPRWLRVDDRTGLVPFIRICNERLERFMDLVAPLIAAGGGGGGGGGSAPTAATVEVDLGSTPKWSGSFTITSASIGATSKVLAWQAPGPYTGKGTRADEAQMQPVNVIAVVPAAGSARVYWETPPMVAEVPFNGSSPLGAGTLANSGTNRDPQVFPKRINRVRGNVKFSYLVMA